MTALLFPAASGSLNHCLQQEALHNQEHTFVTQGFELGVGILVLGGCASAMEMRLAIVRSGIGSAKTGSGPQRVGAQLYQSSLRLLTAIISSILAT